MLFFTMFDHCGGSKLVKNKYQQNALRLRPTVQMLLRRELADRLTNVPWYRQTAKCLNIAVFYFTGMQFNKKIKKKKKESESETGKGTNRKPLNRY